MKTKKSLTIWARGPGTVPYGISGPGFQDKTLNFTRFIHFNWLAKSNWWGPGLLVVNIIGSYYCTRVLLYAKVQKETENEETKLFCHIFIIGGILIGEGRADPFRVILDFPLAWVLDFCHWPKKWEIQFFFEIGLHLPTAPGVFLNRAPQNKLILIEIEPSVLNI